MEKIVEKDKKRTQEDKNDDILFIRDRKDHRKIFIGGKDTRYSKAVQRSKKRMEKMSNSKIDTSPSRAVMLSSSSENETSSTERDSFILLPTTSMDHETQPSTSRVRLLKRLFLSKVKHVSVRAQSDILSQAADISGISSKGMSKSNAHRIGKRVIKETAEAVREMVKQKQGSNMVLYFDGKIVKEYTNGKNL